MSLPRFALAGLLVLSPLAAMAQDGASQPPRREITVSGEGQASAAPDLATISFAVQRNAATAWISPSSWPAICARAPAPHR